VDCAIVFITMSEFLIVAGVVLFAFACKTFSHVVFRKLGNVAILVATFLAGFYLSGGSVVWGCVAILGWFFLPWLEILTRVRKLRLPLDKKLRYRFPPSQEQFPLLDDFTDEVKEEGFVFVDDAGFDWDDMKQFVRFFKHSEKNYQAAIYLNEQAHIAYAYISISSRTKRGDTWTTWNYPFSYTMKFSPDLHVNRVVNAHSFMELLDRHEMFLLRNAITEEQLTEVDPEKIPAITEKELRNQVDHNLDKGLITLSGKGTFRYSWRGMIFLWFQFVKDMVKMS
jgi:hypothetical protein